MEHIGEPGESFNFSSAGRAANFQPDQDRIRQYDPYRKKYVRLSQVGLVSGLLAVAGTVQLWRTGHPWWAGLVALLAVLLLGWAYMVRQGAVGTIYASGLLIPAQITSVEPLQLLALANMNNDPDAPTALHGLQRVTVGQLPMHSLRIGERVPCAAGFGGSHLGGWGYFEPRPLAWATADPMLLLSAVAAIDRDEWNRLDQLALELPPLEDDQIAFYNDELTLLEVK